MPKTIRKAVYAGSFDPITNGHLWMIEQGRELFDELIVAIGSNPEKKYTYSQQERETLLQETVGEMKGVRIGVVERKYLVDYAHSVDAGFILRGIRNEGDYSYERVMRHINQDLRKGVTTVFMMPPREIAEVSSSLVKGLIGPHGWEKIVRQYVPAAVYRFFLKKYSGKKP
jgi:pantetheine-phosphate adenylyltransferase